MACGACAKKAQSANCRYIYTDSKGQQTVYASEVRMLAAKVKDQHRGSTRIECD